MDVKLRPMRNDEFADWLPQMRDDYARSMIEEGGVSPESASQRAAAQTEQLFPGERPSAEQLVFVVEADGEAVGELWLADRDDVLLVHTWEGKPLPREHGGPVRVITPKLYAWKGAKWIRKIEFLAADRKGFWEVRGYSNSAEPWFNDRYATD